MSTLHYIYLLIYIKTAMVHSKEEPLPRDKFEKAVPILRDYDDYGNTLEYADYYPPDYPPEDYPQELDEDRASPARLIIGVTRDPVNIKIKEDTTTPVLKIQKSNDLKTLTKSKKLQIQKKSKEIKKNNPSEDKYEDVILNDRPRMFGPPPPRNQFDPRDPRPRDQPLRFSDDGPPPPYQDGPPPPQYQEGRYQDGPPPPPYHDGPPPPQYQDGPPPPQYQEGRYEDGPPPPPYQDGPPPSPQYQNGPPPTRYQVGPRPPKYQDGPPPPPYPPIQNNILKRREKFVDSTGFSSPPRRRGSAPGRRKSAPPPPDYGPLEHLPHPDFDRPRNLQPRNSPRDINMDPNVRGGLIMSTDHNDRDLGLRELGPPGLDAEDIRLMDVRGEDQRQFRFGDFPPPPPDNFDFDLREREPPRQYKPPRRKSRVFFPPHPIHDEDPDDSYGEPTYIDSRVDKPPSPPPQISPNNAKSFPSSRPRGKGGYRDQSNGKCGFHDQYYGFCKNRYAGHYSHPNNKDCFIQCDEWGLAYVKPCAKGTYWAHKGNGPANYNACVGRKTHEPDHVHTSNADPGHGYSYGKPHHAGHGYSPY